MVVVPPSAQWVSLGSLRDGVAMADEWFDTTRRHPGLIGRQRSLRRISQVVVAIPIRQILDQDAANPKGQRGGRCFLNDVLSTISPSLKVRKSQPSTSRRRSPDNVARRVQSDTPRSGVRTK